MAAIRPYWIGTHQLSNSSRDFHIIIIFTKFGEVSSKTVVSIAFTFFGGKLFSTSPPKSCFIWKITFFSRKLSETHPKSFWTKQSMPLDSQWEVSYRCVIHYDAIFLTVSEIYMDFLIKSRVVEWTKMAAIRPYWIGTCQLSNSSEISKMSEKSKMFDFWPPFLGVLAHPGSKQSMPLDSQWVVSCRCVIHYDAIFLTVWELYGLLLKNHRYFSKKMSAIQPYWIGTHQL